MSNPRNPARARHSTAFRLSTDLLDRLDAEAADRMIGRNRLVEFLLLDGLDRLPEVITAGTYRSPEPTPEVSHFGRSKD